MVTIAVAGGTGKVGRTIVEAIVARGEHEVVVLSRQENKSLEKDLGASILAVDIHNIDALTQVFEKHDVHTVISALGMNGPSPPEIDIIRAAEAAQPTKRFISSDWGLPHTEEHASQANSANNKVRAQEELRKKNLEWTSIHNGFFVDFWGSSATKSNLPRASTFIDTAHRTAAIPGSGDVPVTFTYSRDVAQFVAAFLNLEKWERATFIIGDKVTLNEMVKMVEDITGDKFTVTYDSVEKMKRGELTEFPGHVPVYSRVPKEILHKTMAAYGLWAESGGFNFDESKTLNKTFPDIKPVSVKAFLEEAWGNQKQ
ncbi:Isoflavone reductase like protein IRL [Fusarium austroafricanum]|uniref:Isoflavone reductase like protein IRL n=1 Tax=Fusarium austroafricanum TaxID=2364996 RepID=A0A8H4KTF4_9HYPO|nr:Isoflavone reductase like protein IRL [Fusarium austroafricanum]